MPPGAAVAGPVDEPDDLGEPDGLGLEDELAPPGVPGLPESSEPVLTDGICLIPGDKPVVRIEDAPGNARRIFTGVDIAASVDEVWGVMTDYEGLEDVVPNLVFNQIVERHEAGGARLHQIGRASWEIFGRHFYFQATTTLDVSLHPDGLPEDLTAGCRIDAASLSNAQVRKEGLGTPLVRDIFPRPFSVPSAGVPIRDITMQNVLGTKSDFVHYQGIWRLQPLYGCAPPGESMMRLTFAVEVEPHWFLPVAPVEGRIATALVENMEAIRDHVEAARRAAAADLDDVGSNLSDTSPSMAMYAVPLGRGAPGSPPSLKGTWGSAQPHWHAPTFALQRGWSRCPGHASLLPLSAVEMVDVPAMTDAMAQTLERAEFGSMGETAFSASVGVFSEAAGALATAAEVATGVEAEMLLSASVLAALAAMASSMSAQQQAGAEAASGVERRGGAEDGGEDPGGHIEKGRVWTAICDQSPAAVRDGHFMGFPLCRSVVESRWPLFVCTLGISEEKAFELIEQDATPLLVRASDVAETFDRLVELSSREQALELVSWNPALLVGKAASLKEGAHLVSSVVYDVIYAGRLFMVLEDPHRKRDEKVFEIQLYSWAVLTLKPFLDVLEHGWRLRGRTSLACRRPWQLMAKLVPNSAVRVFLQRVAAAPDPIGFMMDQGRAGVYMAQSLVMRPYLASSILPYSPSILPHLPAIYTNLSILRPHVPSIVRILDPYFQIVEPHLDRIMERMDEIEPHLPYILLHLDVLAKHCGPLLDHFDALMPYASRANPMRALEDWQTCYDVAGGDMAFATRLDATTDVEACMIDIWDKQRPESDIERETRSVSYLPRLLPYVDFLVPLLDKMAHHLPLVHPHLPYILPYLDRLMPYIPLFATLPQASANADVLLGYLGWMLKLPFVPKILYVPLVPRAVAALSGMLPRGPIKHVLEDARTRYEEAMVRADNQQLKRTAPRPVSRIWRRRRWKSWLRWYRWRRAAAASKRSSMPAVPLPA